MVGVVAEKYGVEARCDASCMHLMSPYRAVPDPRVIITCLHVAVQAASQVLWVMLRYRGRPSRPVPEWNNSARRDRRGRHCRLRDSLAVVVGMFGDAEIVAHCKFEQCWRWFLL